MAVPNKGDRYFLALVPPDPSYSAALELKQWFAKKHNSRAALRSPPHITLHMPFQMDENKLTKLQNELMALTSARAPFQVQLNGFGHFKERVIFIHVEQNESMHQLFLDLRRRMKESFNIFNADYKNRGFIPHLTIAFRDLKKSAYHEAWAELQNKTFRYGFMARALVLLKHNDKNWEVFKKFNFRLPTGRKKADFAY